MPDFALAAAGAVVFALTTWALLAFGYQVFQNMWEDDQDDGAALVRLPTDDGANPLRAIDAAQGKVAGPVEVVHPAAPAA